MNIVIGGGTTEMNCVSKSMQHGCRSLIQFEILSKPPLMRRQSWPQWPKVYKLDYGQEEAAPLWQDPREYLIQTRKFVGDAGGPCQGTAHRVRWVRDNGRDPADVWLYGHATRPDGVVSDGLSR